MSNAKRVGISVLNQYNTIATFASDVMNEQQCCAKRVENFNVTGGVSRCTDVAQRTARGALHDALQRYNISYFSIHLFWDFASECSPAIVAIAR